MTVTNIQIQNSFDQDIRPMCNAVVTLMQRINQFKASADDLYSGVNGSGWTDSRTDGPAHLGVESDWYAINTFITLLQKCIAGTASGADVTELSVQWAIVQKLATRDLTGV